MTDEHCSVDDCNYAEHKVTAIMFTYGDLPRRREGQEMSARYSAIDIANFFVDYFRDSDDPMTKLRLQKFLYFAQGESLARFGRPLFDEKIKALKLGPVVTAIDSEYPKGKGPIDIVGKYDPHIFAKEDLELLLDVAVFYGNFSNSALAKLSHEENGPWAAVHRPTGPPAVITQDSIREYFENGQRIPGALDDVIKALPLAGTVCDGHLVLPSSWDDRWNGKNGRSGQRKCVTPMTRTSQR